MDFKTEHPHYLALYQRYLAGRSVRRVMELGVAQGASLRAWLEWFPEALVVGVDDRRFAPGAAEKFGARCTLLTCDQTDPQLAELGAFDLIVDDAGHDPLKQRDSLLLLWPQLNRGGLYVVEDLETSYWELACWNVQKLAGCPMEGWENPAGIVVALKALSDRLTADYVKQRAERFPTLEGLASIHYHPNIVFLEKA